jgi:hypothetical protein
VTSLARNIRGRDRLAEARAGAGAWAGARARRSTDPEVRQRLSQHVGWYAKSLVSLVPSVREAHSTPVDLGFPYRRCKPGHGLRPGRKESRIDWSRSANEPSCGRIAISIMSAPHCNPAPHAGDTWAIDRTKRPFFFRQMEPDSSDEIRRQALMSREPSADLYVLDSIADDVEDIAAILRMLNSDTAVGWQRTWGRPFGRDEVVEALSRLVTADLARVSLLTSDGKGLVALPPKQLPPGSYDDAWFAITSRGRIVHSNWHPEKPGPP